MEAEGGDVMVTMEFSELEGMLRPILQEAVQVRAMSVDAVCCAAALGRCTRCCNVVRTHRARGRTALRIQHCLLHSCAPRQCCHRKPTKHNRTRPRRAASTLTR